MIIHLPAKQGETHTDINFVCKQTQLFACAREVMLRLHGEGDSTRFILRFKYFQQTTDLTFIFTVHWLPCAFSQAKPKENSIHQACARNLECNETMLSYHEKLEALKIKARQSDAA